MAYKYNPNDQRFYDQLAEMSNIDRRSTDQSQKANALKLQNERYILEKIAQLPDDYQKGFKNKRERTPLVYGEDVQDIPEGTPEGDNAFYNLDPEAELNISATPPKDAVIQAEADPRFGNPRVDMNPNAGRMYSPGAAAVLDGLAQPGWNPPMNNPPARPAPGYWMNETPYPAPIQPYRFGMNAPLTEEEIAALEFEKKKEPTPPVEVAASAPAMPAEEAVRPKAELKKNQDPRVSFRRFKADEFLQNNAVFQMDLPRIQPTYATMLGAETALAKSGKDPNAKKDEWDVLKDFETEEGGAVSYNKILNQTRPIPGIKQREKAASASGAPVKIVGPDGVTVYADRKDAIGKPAPEPTEYILWQDPKTGENMLIPKPRNPGTGTVSNPPAGSIPLPGKTPEKEKKTTRTEKTPFVKDGKPYLRIEEVNTDGSGRRLVGEEEQFQKPQSATESRKEKDDKRMDELDLFNAGEAVKRMEELKKQAAEVKGLFGPKIGKGGLSRFLTGVGGEINEDTRQKRAKLTKFIQKLKEVNVLRLSERGKGQAGLNNSNYERQLSELANAAETMDYEAFVATADEIADKAKRTESFLRSQITSQPSTGGGKIKVRNDAGETLEIDESDLEDAKKDGYNPVR